MKAMTRKDYRLHRHRRIRKRVSGTAECPRMAIMVSNKHMYVQMIDDETATTLAAASTVKEKGNNKEVAKALGQKIGEIAKEKGLTRFVVDRGGYRYHGRVRAIVEAALEAGLSNTKEEK